MRTAVTVSSPVGLTHTPWVFYNSVGSHCMLSIKYIATKGATLRQDAFGHNIFNGYMFRYISLHSYIL